MITLCWRRKHTSELDKRGLAVAISQIIPLLLGSYKAVAAISKNVRVNSQLIVK